MNHLKLENCPNCGGKITLYGHTSLADNYECFARCSECKTEYLMPEVQFATHGVWIYPASIKKAERLWNERAVSMCKSDKEAPMSELKPCPFCGSHNVKMFYDERQNYHVECYGCNKTVSFHIVKESSWRKAVDIWNRRAQPANEPLTLDEMNALDHEPIYVLHTGGKWTMNGWHIATASSYQNHGRCDLEIDNGNTTIDMQNYGKTWLAYRPQAGM